ncbi:hypothetical protein E2C01_006079 [Portunus trituberculatus]|uniref:Uncharacterized protein n=1 Tax=Portunus trituberculatus TaxID=210409 RepID=A0A5B7CU75_PORTR|nr:hypothetical protein [Portunus trituberculatus]
MMQQQHKRAAPITFKVGDMVMVQAPPRESKLSPKFMDLRLIVSEGNGNKFAVFDPALNTVEMVHSDRLKKTKTSEPALDSHTCLPRSTKPEVPLVYCLCQLGGPEEVLYRFSLE